MAATLKEIANRAGVSVMAVSAVMNKTTSTRVSERKRAVIEQIAREMGYRSNVVARTLRGGQSRMIGILIDSCAPPSALQHPRHIESEATAGGYRILISEGHDSVDNLAAAYEKFEQYGVDGVICLAYDYPGQQEKSVNISGIRTIFCWWVPMTSRCFRRFILIWSRRGLKPSGISVRMEGKESAGSLPICRSGASRSVFRFSVKSAVI
ncbi:MAG: LacI family DNA-binding transcriptional regulator [Victivallales bacterium]